jgi:hypothetical protein
MVDRSTTWPRNTGCRFDSNQTLTSNLSAPVLTLTRLAQRSRSHELLAKNSPSPRRFPKGNLLPAPVVVNYREAPAPENFRPAGSETLAMLLAILLRA